MPDFDSPGWKKAARAMVGMTGSGRYIIEGMRRRGKTAYRLEEIREAIAVAEAETGNVFVLEGFQAEDQTHALLAGRIDGNGKPLSDSDLEELREEFMREHSRPRGMISLPPGVDLVPMPPVKPPNPGVIT